MKRAPNARWTRIFGLAGLLTLLRRVRRRADAKELAIESREQLFSMLVRNADDIYVMFSPDAYEVEYVSPNVEKLLGVSVEAVKNNIRALSDSAADPSSDPRIDDIASLEEGECLQVFRERIQARTGEASLVPGKRCTGNPSKGWISTCWCCPIARTSKKEV